MIIDLDANEVMKYITEELKMIPRNLEQEKIPMLKKIANIVKENVEEVLPESDIDATATNPDGTKYTHMKNDVKASIKTDKMGNTYAIVRGGKKTGFKWHLVDNGTSKSRALHFTDKAMKKSEDEIDYVVSDVLNKAVSYGR